MTERDNDVTPAIARTPETPPEAASDGVDVTLIRWMLALSPRQRLIVLQQTVRSILRLRNAARRC